MKTLLLLQPLHLNILRVWEKAPNKQLFVKQIAKKLYDSIDSTQVRLDYLETQGYLVGEKVFSATGAGIHVEKKYSINPAILNAIRSYYKIPL